MNQVHTSPLADDIATAQLRPVKCVYIWYVLSCLGVCGEGGETMVYNFHIFLILLFQQMIIQDSPF